MSSTLFTFEALTHAIAGATGNAVAMSAFYPLDLAKTRLQVDTQTKRVKHFHQILAKIIKEEGITALYTGFTPVITTLCCSNFIYFYTFNGLRMLDSIKKLPLSQSINDLIIGMIAGATNVIVTTPLWVVNTRLRLQGIKVRDYSNKVIEGRDYSGVWDCFRQIVTKEGIANLWSGLAPSLMLVCNPAIQFMSYEALKRYFAKGKTNVKFSALLFFAMAAVSKAIATVLTYPMQIAQARLRHKNSSNDKTKKNYTFVGVIREIFRHEGFRGLFKGLETKLIQTVLTAALMFTLYEKIAAFIFWVTGAK